MTKLIVMVGGNKALAGSMSVFLATCFVAFQSFLERSTSNWVILSWLIIAGSLFYIVRREWRIQSIRQLREDFAQFKEEVNSDRQNRLKWENALEKRLESNYQNINARLGSNRTATEELKVALEKFMKNIYQYGPERRRGNINPDEIKDFERRRADDKK